MIYYESGAMAREQKLETLKEIEKVIISNREHIEKLKEFDKNATKPHTPHTFNINFCEEENKLKLQEANKIGEFIGCGKEYPTEAYWDKTEKVFMKCEINNLCPTCQEANETLTRINGN